MMYGSALIVPIVNLHIRIMRCMLCLFVSNLAHHTSRQLRAHHPMSCGSVVEALQEYQFQQIWSFGLGMYCRGWEESDNQRRHKVVLLLGALLFPGVEIRVSCCCNPKTQSPKAGADE